MFYLNPLKLKEISKSTVKHLVFPIAIAFGLGRILLDVLAKQIALSAVAYYSTFIIAFLLEIVAIVFLIKKLKKQQENQLALSEALLVGVMFMVLVGALFALQSYLYDLYWDGEFQKNTALEWAQLYGRSSDVEKMMAGETNIQTTSAVFSIFTSILKFSLLGILVSFIVGSILRNR